MTRLSWILNIPLILQTLCQAQIFNIDVPTDSSFSCLNKTIGFYADISARCKIYHTCDEYGNKFTYHCPEETAFRQDALICDHAHLVRCQGSTSHNHTEATLEGKKNNFPYVTSSVNKTHTLLSSFQREHPRTTNKMHYGFAFNSQKSFKNFSKIETAEDKMVNSFYPLRGINNVSYIKTQNRSTINQQDKSELGKNGNIPLYSPYPGDKFNGKQKMDQKEYVNFTGNVALYNFPKSCSTSFHGNTRNPLNNVNNYKIAKTSDETIKTPLNGSDYSHSKTLKSVPITTKIVSTTVGTAARNIEFATTKLPVYAPTVSLKPLIPAELEYDPYYPQFPTSTESFYTSTYNNKESSHIGSFIQTTWPTVHIKLPSVLPDLNILKDMVDRRNLLYIPRIKFY